MGVCACCMCEHATEHIVCGYLSSIVECPLELLGDTSRWEGRSSPKQPLYSCPFRNYF